MRTWPPPSIDVRECGYLREKLLETEALPSLKCGTKAIEYAGAPVD